MKNKNNKNKEFCFNKNNYFNLRKFKCHVV